MRVTAISDLHGAVQHVHQPLLGRGIIGLTEPVNVGHFQATGRGFTIEV